MPLCFADNVASRIPVLYTRPMGPGLPWKLTHGERRVTTSKPIKGICLCGAVSLTIDEFDDKRVIACHCSQCRKQTGHFFAAAHVQNSKLSISGEEHITWYRASDEAERGFCQQCGSILLWKPTGADHCSVLVGCLEGPTGLRLTRHIFVDDKGDYYDIEKTAELFPQGD